MTYCFYSAVWGGLYQFHKSSFGLTNAPACFMRAMHLVLKGLCWSDCLVYLDDIIFGWTLQEHRERLSLVLVSDSSSYFLANTVYLGDIFHLLWQVVSKEFSSHCCRRWAKVFVICVQVWFYELFPSIIKLSICKCQKRKAVYCLLSEHFPAIDLIDLF